MTPVDIVYICFVLWLGLALGSFSTALIWRVPRGLPWIFDTQNNHPGGKICRSHCPYCLKNLSAIDLVPVFSWLFLRGKCRHCGVSYGFKYLVVEILVAILCFITFMVWGSSLALLPILVSIPFLVALFVIDAEHFILPNQLVFSVAICALAFLVLQNSDNGAVLMETISSRVVASLLYGGFALILGRLMSRVLGKDALGGGDVKLFAVSGLWLGTVYLPFFLILSGIKGIIWAILFRVVSGQSIFPFGPALIITLYIGIILLAYGIIPLVG